MARVRNAEAPTKTKLPKETSRREGLLKEPGPIVAFALTRGEGGGGRVSPSFGSLQVLTGGRQGEDHAPDAGVRIRFGICRFLKAWVKQEMAQETSLARIAGKSK